MGVITFNGGSSRDIGLEVEIPPDYEIPERIYEVTSVPGRNGDLIMDTGSYKNVIREYQVCIAAEGGDFSLLASRLSNWLNSGVGYLRLEDSYEPDYYKLARYVGNTKVANVLQQAGRVTLAFDRKPQRFLKSGENAITIRNSKSLYNPTSNIAKPLIKVVGNNPGTVSIGEYTVSIHQLNQSMYIDCEIEETYQYGHVNTNQYVTLPKGFPLLKSGRTVVSFSGGIDYVEIIPRWWAI